MFDAGWEQACSWKTTSAEGMLWKQEIRKQ